MSGRPEILFPLFAGAETLQGVGPKTAQNLLQIDIETPRDLLLSLPYSVVDRRRRETVRGVDLPATVTVEVTVGRAHSINRCTHGPFSGDFAFCDAFREFGRTHFPDWCVRHFRYLCVRKAGSNLWKPPREPKPVRLPRY